MEFYFPTDVYTLEQQPRSRAAVTSCAFDAHPLFASPFIDVIRQQEAAQARAQAIQRAKAARRAQEEREARAYLEHLYQLQRREEQLQRQREAQRQYQLQLQRQRELQLRQQQRAREEYRHRQMYAEYQRRKAQAVEQERRRISAIREAENQSRHLFLALEDLLFGGLGDFGYDDAHQPQTLSAAAGPSRSTAKQQASAAKPAAATTPTTTAKQAKESHEHGDKDKGKGKATNDGDNVIDALCNTLLGRASPVVEPGVRTEGQPMDEDPEEVGPVPASESGPVDQAHDTAAKKTTSDARNADGKDEENAKKADVLVFSHDFPAGGSKVASSIKADSIRVSVDEETNKVTVSGLWKSDAGTADASRSASPVVSAKGSYTIRPSSPTPSTDSRTGRSRSPKRARVSDVDENGDEIMAPEQDKDDDGNDAASNASADGFVKLDFGAQGGEGEEDARSTTSSSNTAASDVAPTERTFELPAGARAEDLRAELTDEGLKLWASTRT